MLTTSERKRFAALRRREEKGMITASEKTELDRLIQQVETEEAAYLQPAT